MEKIELSWKDVRHYAQLAASEIADAGSNLNRDIVLYGIPRGGIYAALLISEALTRIGVKNTLTDIPNASDVIVDDIRDTGNTIERVLNNITDFEGGSRMVSVLYRGSPSKTKAWIVFPWEQMTSESGPQENVTRMIQYIGEDVSREGLRDTPSRVVRSWSTLFGGYKQQPQDILRCFEDGACDEMVLLKDIEFYSHCEHHIMPFHGRVHIGYLPNKRVVGVSKLARLVEMYSRRLQIQERLGQQIADAIMEHVGARGAACMIEAQHFCMTSRGVQKQNSIMVTSALRGCMREEAARDEFLRLVKG